MLQIDLAGKSVVTTDEKQIIKINNNDVEIERIGNSIYVNQLPINLIVVDKDNKWKNILFLAVVLPTIATIGYFISINHETATQVLDGVVGYIQIGTDLATDTIGGLINGNESGTTSK